MGIILLIEGALMALGFIAKILLVVMCVAFAIGAILIVAGSIVGRKKNGVCTKSALISRIVCLALGIVSVTPLTVLLGWGAVNEIVNPDPTPVHTAAMNRNVGKLERLLKNGHDPNELGGWSGTETVLLEFCRVDAIRTEKDVQVVELLLSYGADVNAQCYNGVNGNEQLSSTPLMYIISGMSFLGLTEGGDKHIRFVAGLVYNIEIAELLLQNGADVNLQNEFGYTALTQIAIGGDSPERYEIAKLLIEAGADVNHQDKEGHSVLTFMQKSGGIVGETEPLAELLISNGAVMLLDYN